MVTVIGRVCILQRFGTALEDDVDHVAIEGHLRVVVECVAIPSFHVIQFAPRSVVQNQRSDVLRGDGLASVGRCGKIDIAPMHVIIPIHVIAENCPAAPRHLQINQFLLCINQLIGKSGAAIKRSEHVRITRTFVSGTALNGDNHHLTITLHMWAAIIVR